MSTSPRRRATAAAALVILATVTAGCGASGGDDEGARERATTTTTSTTTAAPTTSPEPDDGDPCPDGEEIAEIVGVEVDQLSHSGGSGDGELSVAATGCAYLPVDDAGDLRVVVARLTTEDDLDGRLFDALAERAEADVLEDGFTELSVEGAEAAYLDGLQAVIRSEGTMLFVAVEPDGDPQPGDEEPSIELAAAVAALGVDPDDPDCDALEGLVAEQLGEPVDATISGGGIAIDDVSITTSGCGFELADGTEVSIAAAPDDQWDAWVAAKQASSFTASYEELEVAGRQAFDDGEALVVDDGTDGAGDSPHQVEVSDSSRSAEDAAALRLAVAELVIGG